MAHVFRKQFYLSGAPWAPAAFLQRFGDPHKNRGCYLAPLAVTLQLIASLDLAEMGGRVIDIGDVIRDLDAELGLTVGDAMCEAIRRGDDNKVREHSLLDGPSTLAPKKEAILAGRPDLLTLLLERDNSVDEDMVTAACKRKDRDSIRILLDFGWPIDKPINCTASLLRSV